MKNKYGLYINYDFGNIILTDENGNMCDCFDDIKMMSIKYNYLY